MSWTEERVDLLKKLWSDGLSASVIAAELGGVTRNAVIGKVHRIGLDTRRRVETRAPRVRKPRLRIARFTGVPVRSAGNTALAMAFAAVPEPELIDNVIPLEQRRTLLQLTDVTCKWGIGDPSAAEFYFCGGRTLPELPYCAYHCRLAYQPASPRRRRDRPIVFNRPLSTVA